MKKKILATRLVGILINNKPWEKAHVLWFKDAGEKLGRPDICDWGGIYTQKEDYFKKVDEVLRLQYKDLSDEQRTKKARKLYFKYVLEYIEKYPDVINQEVVNKYNKFKKKYVLALVSTSSNEIITQLIGKANLEGFFDIIYTSDLTQKDSREKVYESFVAKYGKPIYYIQTLDDLDNFSSS